MKADGKKVEKKGLANWCLPKRSFILERSVKEYDMDKGRMCLPTGMLIEGNMYMDGSMGKDITNGQMARTIRANFWKVIEADKANGSRARQLGRAIKGAISMTRNMARGNIAGRMGVSTPASSRTT